jgi:AhpD family alkylhydroperoxidase
VSAAVGSSSLGAQTGERIALAVAQSNGCNYCLSAHSYLGRHVAKLDDAEMSANRNGTSNDIKAAAAVRFATQVVEARGHVSDAQLEAVKRAGYDDAAIIEIVLAVALNTFTNYINEVAKTEIDFPVVEAGRLAA